MVHFIYFLFIAVNMLVTETEIAINFDFPFSVVCGLIIYVHLCLLSLLKEIK
jgi:hypothetical protein